jgi:toxin ParE1/3/4
MSGFRLTPAAQDDLDDIWDHTATTWNIEQAERYILLLRDRIVALAAGRSVAQRADEIKPGYRRSLVGAHVIFFRQEPGNVLTVVRILHQSMDAPHRLLD